MKIVTKEMYAEMSIKQRALLVRDITGKHGQPPKACVEGEGMADLIKRFGGEEEWASLDFYNGRFYAFVEFGGVCVPARVSSDDL